MKAKHVITSSAILAACILGLFVWFGQRDVHKLLMPGKYRVYLTPHSYAIFHFWKWPSKQVSAANTPTQVAVFDSNKNEILQGVEKQMPSNKFGVNVGRIEGDFKIKTAGYYYVYCNDNAVIVILPEDSYDDFFNCFAGSNDDFNFENQRE